jgi:integral membrane sensor domain MASE1
MNQASKRQELWVDLAWAIGYLALYILFDWVSFIHPYAGLDITPWNPPAGISLAFLLRRGLRFSPLLLLVAPLSDVIVRGVNNPWLPTLIADFIEAGGYIVGAFLLAKVMKIDPKLSTLHDVLALLAMTTGVSLLTSTGFIQTYHLAGVIPDGDVASTWFRFWIGDMIGVAIFTPLCLTLGQPALRPNLRNKTSAGIGVLQGFAILLALWIAFGGDLAQRPEMYYPLFMPLVWIGAWHGLQGVTVALFATQIGMIVAIQEAHLDTDGLTEVQFFLLALTLTSLLLGAIVTERRRSRLALRDSQTRLKAVIDVASDGVLTLDEAGQVETVNPAFEWLAGRPAAQMIGCPATALFPGLAQALAGRGGKALLERPDGADLWVELAVGEAVLSDRKIRVASIWHANPEREQPASNLTQVATSEH